MARVEADREQYIEELEAKLTKMEQELTGLENKNEKLELDLEKFSKAFYASNAWMVISRLSDGIFIDLNESFSKSLGYTRKDMIGKSAVESGIWADPEEREILVNKINEDGYVKDFYSKFRRKSNEIGIALSSIEIIDVNGEKCLLTSGIDITKQKKAEEMFYKAFHENQVPMSITRVADGVLIDANKNYAETMGCRREDIIGKSNYSELNICRLCPEERQEKLKQLKEAGFIENLELQVKRGNNEIGHVMSTHSLLNLDGELCRLTSAIDITERKKAEERFYKSFHNNQTAMSISRLKDGIYIDVNDKYASSMGYNRQEMIGKSVLGLNIWGDIEDKRNMHKCLVNEGYIRDEIYTFRNRSGEIRYALASLSLISIDGEEYVLTSFIDITERQKGEEALSRSQKLFFQVFNNIPLSIVVISLKDFRVVEVNDTFLTRNNVSREEIIGQKNAHYRLWREPQQMDIFSESIRRCGLVRNFEIQYKFPDGEIRTILLSGIHIDWEGEECILSVSNDITELRQYQNEISRLDNINLIGQMAAGVAHEVRNPMTAIKGFLQLFYENENYAEDKETIELMVEELDRVNEIITTFLSLAQGKTTKLRLLSLNNQVSNLLPLITSDVRKADINIQTEFASTQKVMLDKGEFRQLLLNLTHNGIEAMTPGGTLTIKTFDDENGVNLTVRDEGSGISSEVLKKLGTPFLTTKDHGTGLGLALCYSIAERHKARITVDTSPAGTTFRVIFPVVV